MPIVYMVHFDILVDPFITKSILHRLGPITDKAVMAFLSNNKDVLGPPIPVTAVYELDELVERRFKEKIGTLEVLLRSALTFIQQAEKKEFSYAQISERILNAEGDGLERVCNAFKDCPKGLAELRDSIKEVDKKNCLYSVLGGAPSEGRLKDIVALAEKKKQGLGFTDDIVVLGGTYAEACVPYSAKILSDKYDLKIDLGLTDFPKVLLWDAFLIGLSNHFENKKLEKILVNSVKETYLCMLEKYKRSVDTLYFSDPLDVSILKGIGYKHIFERYMLLSRIEGIPIDAEEEPRLKRESMDWLRKNQKGLLEQNLQLFNECVESKKMRLKPLDSPLGLLE